MNARALLLCFGSLLLVTSTRGQETVAMVDPDLPKPLEAGHFEVLMGNSPFLRVLNLTETYALRGIAEIDGVPVATLFNRETKKSVLVTAHEANAEQMRLMEVSNSADDFLIGMSATIAVAGEEVELKFEPDRIAPKPKNPGSSAGNHGSGGSDQKDGDRPKGPSKEDIARYQALPEEKKEKLREYIRQTMQRYPDMSREERGNLIRGAMTRLSDGGEIAVDPAASGGGTTRPSGGTPPPSSSSSNRGDRDRR